VRQVELDHREEDRDQPEAERAHFTFLLSWISAACAAGAEAAVSPAASLRFRSIKQSKLFVCY
jgi:hypothetical protein